MPGMNTCKNLPIFVCMRTIPRNIRRSRSPLPKMLKSFFWDRGFRSMSLSSDADFVVGRLLAEGTRESVRWLRRRVGDETLRTWFTQHSGRGLTPRKLRFWELVLKLDHRKVNTWVARQKDDPWHRRSPP